MYDNPGKCISLKATAAVTAKYTVGKYTADGLAVATAQDDPIVGFIQREGKATEALPVMINGISMGIASAAISKGAKVAATTGGALVTATAGDQFVGIALEAATAANDIIPVLIQFGTVPTT